MSDLPPEVTEAIDVLARWSIYNAVEMWTEEGWMLHLDGSPSKPMSNHCHR